MLKKPFKFVSLSIALAVAPFLVAQDEEPAVEEPTAPSISDLMGGLIAEIQTSGETMQLLENLGDLHIQTGDTARAVAVYEQAIAKFGGSENLYYKLSRILLVMRRPELAHEIMKVGVEAFPNSAKLQFEVGQAYTAFGKYYAALAALRRAQALDPENDSYRYHMALAYRARKDTDKAMEIVDELLEKGGKEIPLHLLKGDLLMVQGEHRSAVRTLEDLYEEHPDSPDTKRVLVYAYQQYAYSEGSEGRLGRAIRTMEKSLELAPENAESRTGLAAFLKETGDNERAEEVVKVVLETSPDYLDAYVLYGSLLDWRDQKKEAAAAYRDGLARARALEDQTAVEQFSELLGLNR